MSAAPQLGAAEQDHVRLASAAPGRLRVRLHRLLRHPTLLRRVHHHLEQQPGVHHVEVNPASGSVTVRYDPNAH